MSILIQGRGVRGVLGSFALAPNLPKHISVVVNNNNKRGSSSRGLQGRPDNPANPALVSPWHRAERPSTTPSCLLKKGPNGRQSGPANDELAGLPPQTSPFPTVWLQGPQLRR